jgi:phosphatidylserine/phosphatidylglycerophosphate/cardiolipin synthase-like enzyme
VEIRYNPDVHAKLYISWHREENDSFALFGSGNLTSGGVRYNLELGMMILARGHGKKLIRELYDWSANALRTKSQRVKPIQALQ